MHIYIYTCVYIRVRNRREWRIHSLPRCSGELSHFPESRTGSSRREEKKKKKKTRICASFEKKVEQPGTIPSAGEQVQRIAVEKRRTLRVIIRFAGATFNQQPAYLPSLRAALPLTKLFARFPDEKNIYRVHTRRPFLATNPFGRLRSSRGFRDGQIG